MPDDLPDPTFHLTDQQRAALEKDVNADVLERLLQRLPPTTRAECLAVVRARFLTQAPNIWFRVIGIPGITDPEISKLFDQLYELPPK